MQGIGLQLILVLSVVMMRCVCARVQLCVVRVVEVTVGSRSSVGQSTQVLVLPKINSSLHLC